MEYQNHKNKIDYNSISYYIFFVLFMICVSAFGQNKEKDSSNFVFYPDKIMIRTNLNSQTDEYTLNDKKGDNLYLMTNNNYKLFFSVDYKFIGFSYGFYPGFIGGNKDEDLKGKSTFSDYNFRFFLGKWLQTVNYSKTRGYYVDNTNDFNQNWQEGIDPYLQLPNFKTITYGMSTSYIFNPKFSLKSITSFTEWQEESAGSFVPTLVYDYNRISYEVSIADELQKEYDISLGAGYFYNFIIHKHFYIAPNLTPSIGVKFSNSTETQIDPSGNVTSKESDTYFTTNFDGGLKMGYNSDRILFGMSLVFNVSSYSETKTSIVSENKAYGLLYFGYRFNAPNFISKPVKVIDDKLKL
jgi:hypothetical protein